MSKISKALKLEQSIHEIDSKYSERFIKLDPEGYFLIKLSLTTYEIIVEHYSNDIAEDGKAIDPETGQVIECTNNQQRIPQKIYRGRTAKKRHPII